MAIFLTGTTGYIGSHIVAGLLESSSERLNLLLRARNVEEAENRLWQALQLNLDFPRFYDHLRSRITLFCGDITSARFGLDKEPYEHLAHSTDAVIHCAASLNRKSEKSCLNVNLRGTLEVIQFAARARDHHGLRRFAHVSTVAVAGHRNNEVVQEDQAIQWDRSDYDPYARTKKFCEHMVRELLPDVSRLILRPSIVLGHSRRAQTTQFDMVRAFVFLANLPILPLHPADQIDIVPVDFVADSIVALFQKEKPQHEIYHLSAGSDSETYRELTDSLSSAQHRNKPLFAPVLESPFTWAVKCLSFWKGSVGSAATLLRVFLPYLVWNTVFDNTRIVSETGCKPSRFSEYCYPLLQFSKENHFRYPYQEWPQTVGGRQG